LDRTALVDSACALVPALRQRAEQTDRERRVPDASLAAMQSAGLFRSLKPATYGGYECGLIEHAAIAMELARGCASSGWVFSMINETSWFISLFPGAAQDEVWADVRYAAWTAAQLGDARNRRVNSSCRTARGLVKSRPEREDRRGEPNHGED